MQHALLHAAAFTFGEALLHAVHGCLRRNSNVRELTITKNGATIYGMLYEPQDLSEKHLAYFSSVPMPELTDYPEGEYPYDPAQAGEGVYVLEGTDVLDAGVSFYMSTSSLAAGVGVLAEEYAPYCNAEGNDLSFIGEDPVIYAQYTYQMEASNHAACRRTARQIGTKKCTFYKEE
jgi:hypothetical protein